MLFLITIVVYIRCAWVNVFTRGGYALLLLAFVLHSFHAWAWTVHLALWPGLVILILARFAYPTYSAYKRTMVHMLKREMPDVRFITEMLQMGYCFEEGFNLALKDSFAIKALHKKDKAKEEARP